MKPFNIFAQSALLFVIGALLILRSPNTQSVDRLFGFIMLLFAVTRMLEFTSIKFSTEHMGRSIAFVMWFIPLVLLLSSFAEKRRPDIFAACLVSVFFLLYYFVQLLGNYNDKFYITSPNRDVGPTDGMFGWNHSNSNNMQVSFLPFLFYLMLTVSLIYTVASFFTSLTFWLGFIAVLISAIVGSYVIHLYHGEIMPYFWSTLSISFLAIGIFMTLLSPG